MHDDAQHPAVPFRDLAATPLTRESFAPFGDLIEPSEDGIGFGPADAQLDLSQGTPRFYIMKLSARPLAVSHITRHRRVTQCLASVGGLPWAIAVAPPLGLTDPSAEPDPADVKLFIIPGDRAIKLHAGTWHAGPLFTEAERAFFNLELGNTNEVDHQNSRFDRRFGFAFRIAAPIAV